MFFLIVTYGFESQHSTQKRDKCQKLYFYQLFECYPQRSAQFAADTSLFLYLSQSQAISHEIELDRLALQTYSSLTKILLS